MGSKRPKGEESRYAITFGEVAILHVGRGWADRLKWVVGASRWMGGWVVQVALVVIFRNGEWREE